MSVMHPVRYDPSLQKETTRHRQGAAWAGLLIGLLGLLLAVAVCLAFTNPLFYSKLAAPGSWFISVWIVAAELLVFGTVAWMRARWIDDKNYLVQKATPMPLALAGQHNLIWTEGRIRCPKPVMDPVSGMKCAFYEAVEMERQPNGNQEPVVVKRYASTWLEQDGRSIRLDLRRATFDHLPTVVPENGAGQVLTFLPAIGRVSACGVVAVGDKTAFARRTESDARDRAFAVSEKMAARAERAGRSQEKRATRRLERQAGKRRKPKPGVTTGDGAEGEELELKLTAEDMALIHSSDDDTPATWRPSRPWRLGPAGSSQLLVTLLPRNEWNDLAEAWEIQWRAAAGVMLLFGLALLLLAVGGESGLLSTTAAGVAGALGPCLLLSAAILLPLLGLSTYNRFVAYRVRVHSAWAHIDVFLCSRHAVVPNLLEVVRAATGHEAVLFEQLSTMRAQATEARKAADVLESEHQFGRLARQLMVTVENLPDLKTSESYTKLHNQLTGLEEKIAYGRSFYNQVVNEYNTLIQGFPALLVAAPLGFRPMPLWKPD